MIQALQCEAGRLDHVDGASGAGCGRAGRVGPADGPAPLPGVPGHGEICGLRLSWVWNTNALLTD